MDFNNIFHSTHWLVDYLGITMGGLYLIVDGAGFFAFHIWCMKKKIDETVACASYCIYISGKELVYSLGRIIKKGKNKEKKEKVDATSRYSLFCVAVYCLAYCSV